MIEARLLLKNEPIYFLKLDWGPSLLSHSSHAIMGSPIYKFPSWISALTSPSSSCGNSNVLSLNTHFHIPNIKNQYKMGNVYQQLVAKCGGQVFKGGGEALERCRNLCFEGVCPLSQLIIQSVVSALRKGVISFSNPKNYK